MLEPFEIEYPAISSGPVYTFTTDEDIDYEVRFARKKENLLHVTIAFGVLNDEFEGEEYVITNKGEVYRVMATIVKIIKTYLEHHPNVRIMEFTGVPVPGESEREETKRLKLYVRYLPEIFNTKEWEFIPNGNHMICKRTNIH